ncbi:MAG TPA: GIY-YIG nuclease family protein [Lacipirellula sp.]
MPNEPEITVFCPECSHAVSGPPDSFAAARVCLGCGEKVTLVDYSREKIPPPPEPKKKPSITWADQALRALVVLGVLLALLAVWAIWTSSGSGALWAGVGCLAVAVPLVVRYAYLQREVLRVQEALRRTERALVVSNAKITAAAEINRGFHKNIEKVAAEERRRVQTAFGKESRKLVEQKEDVDWRMRRTEDQNRIVKNLGEKILNDGVDRVSGDLTARNFEASRRRLQEVIEFCRENDYPISPRKEEDLLAQLTHRYNRELRLEQERQRRDAVSARLQAEQRVHQQMQSEITRVEAQRSAIRRRLNDAKAASESAESSSTTLNKLKAELAAAEQKARDATSIAQHARAGHVLVLSNVGSFGEGVFKIALSRRIDPLEAVSELAREATPFPFDVHMVVSSENASELVNTLHEALHDCRVNRIDLGKDFFRTDIEAIWRLIVAHHGGVECQREAPADEFRESQAMSDERFAHVTQMMRSRESWSSGFGDED